MWLYFCTTALHCKKKSYFLSVVVISSYKQTIKSFGSDLSFKKYLDFHGPLVFLPNHSFHRHLDDRHSQVNLVCTEQSSLEQYKTLTAWKNVQGISTTYIFCFITVWIIKVAFHHNNQAPCIPLSPGSPFKPETPGDRLNTVRERCGSAILGWDVCESKETVTRCTRSANHSLYACETWISSLSFFTWSSRLTYPPWNKYNHFQLISLFCSIFFVYTKEVNALALLTYNYFLSLCSSLKLTKNEEHNTHTCFSRELTPIHICIQIHTDIQKYTNLVSQGLLSVLGSLVFQENLIQSTAGV